MKAKFNYFFTGVFLGYSLHCFGEVPAWAKADTLKRSGEVVTIVCNGSGPSLNVARQEALSNCQVSVSQFLDSEMKMTSISVETEKSVGFHQEVSQMLNLKNLECIPKKDEVMNSDGNFQFWIKCEFDLKKVVIEKYSSGHEVSNPEIKSMSVSLNKDFSDKKVLFVEVLPQCESILIPGKKAKIVNCSQNPLKVLLDEEDETLIIRKSGYLPKSMSIKDNKNGERITVLLEKN